VFDDEMLSITLSHFFEIVGLFPELGGGNGGSFNGVLFKDSLLMTALPHEF
jgi:hypothetical protein